MTHPPGPVVPISWEYLQENLVTQHQIAERLRVDRSVMTRWKKYPDWPGQVLGWPTWTHSGVFELFWWPDVQAFCERHNVVEGRGMRRGRPPQGPGVLTLLPAVSTG